jgi:2-amino-4-hydroxy-6-hydroxymethyldihydropteridine diphosphokinase
VSVVRDPDPPRFALSRASPRGFAQAFVHEGREGPPGAARGDTPLLLIHGASRTHRLWWPTLPGLREAGFEVIAPDLRGCGDSEGLPETRYGVGEHVADLTALARGVLGCTRVVAVAHAEGAVVAQALSLRQPGFVERLVLIDPPLAASRDQAADGRPLPEPTSRGGVHGLADPALEWETSVLAGRINPTPTRLLWSDSAAGDPAVREARAQRRFPALEASRRVREVTLVPWEAPQAVIAAIPRRGSGEADHADRSPAPAAAERAFVSLGSNLGDRESLLVGAVAALRAIPEVADVVVSPVYETDPVGPGEQGPYLNAVARFETTLDPSALLERLQQIERAAGRERGPERNAPRSLDLDLLFLGERCIDSPRLELPHPRLHERPFVLEPLCDLAPDWRHPRLGETIEALARRVRDPAAVRRRGV